MGIGDAHIFCVVLDSNRLHSLRDIKTKIDLKEAMINKIADQINKHVGEGNKQRSKEGLKLISEVDDLYDNIIDSCKTPVAMYYICSDNWNGYDFFSKYLYKAMKLKEFISIANKKIIIGWLEQYKGKCCVCLPCHQDNEEELFYRLGIHGKLDQYNKSVDKKEYECYVNSSLPMSFKERDKLIKNMKDYDGVSTIENNPRMVSRFLLGGAGIAPDDWYGRDNHVGTDK